MAGGWTPSSSRLALHKMVADIIASLIRSILCKIVASRSSKRCPRINPTSFRNLNISIVRSKYCSSRFFFEDSWSVLERRKMDDEEWFPTTFYKRDPWQKSRIIYSIVKISTISLYPREIYQNVKCFVYRVSTRTRDLAQLVRQEEAISGGGFILKLEALKSIRPGGLETKERVLRLFNGGG